MPWGVQVGPKGHFLMILDDFSVSLGYLLGDPLEKYLVFLVMRFQCDVEHVSR